MKALIIVLGIPALILTATVCIGAYAMRRTNKDRKRYTAKSSVAQASVIWQKRKTF